jgi:photosystem II stability/assembly factor-like uncharacterized protein
MKAFAKVLLSGMLVLTLTCIASAQWVDTGLPSGFQKLGIAAKGDTVIVGLYLGGVYISTNHGVSWNQAGATIPSNAIAWAVAFAGSKMLVGTTTGMYVSTDNGATWTIVNTGLATPLTYNSLFVVGSTVYAAGTTGVTVSTDNGTTWTPINGTGLPITDLQAVGTVGSNIYVSTRLGPPYGIWRSTNGGANWAQTSFSNGSPYNFSVIPNGGGGSNIFVSGGNRPAFSTDRGTTWTLTGGRFTEDCHWVSAIPNGSGGTNLFWAGGSGVTTSADNGNHWLRANQGWSPDPHLIYSLASNATYLFAAGFEGVFRRLLSDFPLNAVASTPLNIGTTADLGGASFIDHNYGCVAGTGGTVRITTNGGQTWTASNTGTTTDLSGIKLIGSVGFITGGGGLICISTNNGGSWTPFTTGTTETFNGSSFTSSTAGWAVGTNGTIYRYNGTNWTAQTTGTTIEFKGVAAVGTTGYAVGAGGTIRRYNGTTWVPQVSGTAITFYGVSFVNDQIGYAAGASGTICKTTNGGTSWVPLNSGTSAAIRSIRATSLSGAFAVGDGGLLLQTSNGGTSWQPQSLGTSSNLAAIDVADGLGIIVGAGGIGYSFSSPLTSVREIAARTELPKLFALEQNYPNPFNPTTNIRFRLPAGQAEVSDFGFASLKVFDILGREVATLVNGEMKPGSYDVTFDASKLASGLYVYQLQTSTLQETKKMLLLR